MTKCKYCNEIYDDKLQDYNGCCCAIHNYELSKMKVEEIYTKIKSETSLDSYINLLNNQDYNGYTLTVLLVKNILKDRETHNKLINNDNDILETLSFKEMIYVINNIEKCNINIFLQSLNDMYERELSGIYFNNQLKLYLNDIQDDRRNIVEAFLVAYKLS